MEGVPAQAPSSGVQAKASLSVSFTLLNASENQVLGGGAGEAVTVRVHPGCPSSLYPGLPDVPLPESPSPLCMALGGHLGWVGQLFCASGRPEPLEVTALRGLAPACHLFSQHSPKPAPAPAVPPRSEAGLSIQPLAFPNCPLCLKVLSLSTGLPAPGPLHFSFTENILPKFQFGYIFIIIQISIEYVTSSEKT